MHLFGRPMGSPVSLVRKISLSFYLFILGLSTRLHLQGYVTCLIDKNSALQKSTLFFSLFFLLLFITTLSYFLLLLVSIMVYIIVLNVQAWLALKPSDGRLDNIRVNFQFSLGITQHGIWKRRISLLFNLLKSSADTLQSGKIMHSN